MAISLYDISVRPFLQTVGAIDGVLAAGAASGVDINQLVTARLHDDMLPFRFQVQSVVHHSIDAIDGVKAGAFSPSPAIPEQSYAELQASVADALARLKALTPGEVNALEGNDVIFSMGERFKLPFTAVGFLTSFSLPNMHFHAATTYGMLRARGVKLGKKDYMGAMWVKG